MCVTFPEVVRQSKMRPISDLKHLHSDYVIQIEKIKTLHCKVETNYSLVIHFVLLLYCYAYQTF